MKEKFIWIAIGIALTLFAMQFVFGVASAENTRGLPLLMVLLMNEFGLLLCCAGGFVGTLIVKDKGVQPILLFGIFICVILCATFLWALIHFYPAS